MSDSVLTEGGSDSAEGGVGRQGRRELREGGMPVLILTND